MFDTIRLSKFVGGSWVADVDLEEIAETLGLNYDSGTSVLYAGNNPDNGILVTVASNQITFKLWINGAEATGNNAFGLSCQLNNQYAVISYKKSDNGVAFGCSASSGVEVLKIIVSAGKNNLDINKIGYICANTSSGYIHNLLEDGTYEFMNFSLPGGSSIYSNVLVSAAPLFNVAGNVIFDHVFIGVCFNNNVGAQYITVESKEYIVMTKFLATSAPILLEL